jgi:hypothetical protein
MGRKAATKATPEKAFKCEAMVIFLAALASGLTITLAAQEACINKVTAYRWRQADREFAEAWDEALDEANDRLEQEALRRGRDGVSKPVYQGGRLVGRVQDYSDTLLIFMLKARRPEVYRERASFEHTGKGGKELPAAASNTTVRSGVLVVPGIIEDPAAWTALVQRHAREHEASAAGAAEG